MKPVKPVSMSASTSAGGVVKTPLMWTLIRGEPALSRDSVWLAIEYVAYAERAGLTDADEMEDTQWRLRLPLLDCPLGRIAHKRRFGRHVYGNELPRVEALVLRLVFLLIDLFAPFRDHLWVGQLRIHRRSPRMQGISFSRYLCYTRRPHHAIRPEVHDAAGSETSATRIVRLVLARAASLVLARKT